MCLPGISALSDGRIMVTGGNSDYKTSIYDPVANDWSVGPQMNIPRGYQVRQLGPRYAPDGGLSQDLAETLTIVLMRCFDVRLSLGQIFSRRSFPLQLLAASGVCSSAASILVASGHPGKPWASSETRHATTSDRLLQCLVFPSTEP